MKWSEHWTERVTYRVGKPCYQYKYHKRKW